MALVCLTKSLTFHNSVCAAILQHCGYACVLGSFGKECPWIIRKGMSLDPLTPALFGPAGLVEPA